MNLGPNLKEVSEQYNSLYHPVMLSHHRSPVGFNRVINVSHSHSGAIPSCGDEITIQLEVVSNKIVKLAFTGDSCAICRASASLLCQHLEQESVQRARIVMIKISQALRGDVALDDVLANQYSPILSIREFPVRTRCALLPWETFRIALARSNK